MNAPVQTTTKLPNVPLGRFEPLSVSASVIAEALMPLQDRNAKETFAQISTTQQRLQSERLAAERAIVALAEAKAEQKRVEGLANILISTSIGLGRICGFDDVADFANQDDAWLLTVEGLVAAFNTHDDFGRQFAERLTVVMNQTRSATAEFERAMEAHANIMSAYSNSYRALASAISFGRAVLANLGVEIPRVAPVSRKKATKDPVDTNEVSPTPAPLS